MRTLLIPMLLLASSAFADKLPYSSEFPKAKYPYAKAEDGCSSWDNDHPEYVPDRFFFSSFANACDHHDWCYYTFGKTANECNDEFRSRLLATCSGNVANAGLCRSAALSYWAVVVGAAPSVFKAAQDMQERYLDYADSVFESRFERLVGRPIPQAELEYIRAFLVTGTLDSWEQGYLAPKFGPEIVRTVYKEVIGEAVAESQIPRFVDMIIVYGKNRMINELINQNATAIVQKIWREVHGGTLSPLRLAYFRNLLISTHDVVHVRNIISNTRM